jgi:hypothetical protein
MNTKPNDGGPVIEITLRDYFAGKALEGAAHRLINPYDYRDILASDCYQIADAMLSARERKEGDQ